METKVCESMTNDTMCQLCKKELAYLSITANNIKCCWSCWTKIIVRNVDFDLDTTLTELRNKIRKAKPYKPSGE